MVNIWRRPRWFYCLPLQCTCTSSHNSYMHALNIIDSLDMRLNISSQSFYDQTWIALFLMVDIQRRTSYFVEQKICISLLRCDFILEISVSMNSVHNSFKIKVVCFCKVLVITDCNICIYLPYRSQTNNFMYTMVGCWNHTLHAPAIK